MAAYYYDALTALTPSGHWRLNDTSGSTAAAVTGSSGTIGYFEIGETSERVVNYAQSGLPAISESESIELSNNGSIMETSCHVRLPLSGVTGESDWSVTFLVKIPSTLQSVTRSHTLVSLHKQGSSYVLDDDDLAQFATYSDTQIYAFSGATHTPSASAVYVVTYVFSYDSGSGNATHRLYIDNTALTAGVGSFSGLTFDELVLGCAGSDSGTDYEGFSGHYQDAAYFTRVLSAAEIQTLVDAKNGVTGGSINNTFTMLYDSDGSPAPSGTYESHVSSEDPRRWYKCDENIEGVVTDYGSDEIDAIAVPAGVTSNRLDPGGPVSGRSLRDTDIRVPSLFGTNVYTVSFWAHEWGTGEGTDYYLFGASTQESPGGSGAQVYIKNGEIQFYYTFWSSAYTLPDTAPIMVTVTSSGTEYNLFVNGQPSGVTPVSGGSAIAYARFGTDKDGGNPSGAVLDEILIFDRLLSDAEIAELYAESTSTGEAGAAVCVSVQGSQTSAVAAVNTPPSNYCLAIQGSQRQSVAAVKTGSNNLNYFATAGLTTTPTSTPANEVIPPTLKNPGNVYREINLNDFGIVKPSFGEIVISNLDGSHDDLLTKKIDGQKVTLYRGKRGADFPNGFTQVMTTTAAGIASDYNQIRVKLRDSLALLETPVLKRQFAGTGGVEGDTSVANESKQRHFLCSTYIPPKLINAQKLIYILSDNNAAESPGNKWRVYDGGVEIERSADYASLSEIDIVAPAAGKCRLFINQDGGVYLRLGSTPAYDVRVLPTWVTSSSVPDSGYFAQEIIEEIGGITVDDTGPVVEGRIVLDNDETVSDFLSDFCKSQAYNIWTNQLNAVQIQRFRYLPGAVTSSYDFTQNEIIAIKVENIIPAWKITLNCGQAFPSSLASGADDTIKADLSKQDYMKSVSVEDITVKSAHKLASSLSIDTKAYVTDDATMLSVFQSIFSVDRQVIYMDVVVSDETLTLDLNDVVTLTMPRFNLNSGKNFVVVGIRTDFALNRLNLTLWG